MSQKMIPVIDYYFEFCIRTKCYCYIHAIEMLVTIKVRYTFAINYLEFPQKPLGNLLY